jgi:hypothetical protein
MLSNEPFKTLPRVLNEMRIYISSLTLSNFDVPTPSRSHRCTGYIRSGKVRHRYVILHSTSSLLTLFLSGVQVPVATAGSLSQHKIKHPWDNPTFQMDQGQFSTCMSRWQRKKTIKWPIAGKRMQMASLFSWALISISTSFRFDQLERSRRVYSLLLSLHWLRYRSRT